jgi:tetratricopeptide (TPR) repeat protein
VLGAIDFSQGRISEALSAYQEALGLFRESGDRHGESGVLNRLGTAYFTQGNLQGAGLYYEKALQILLEFGDRRGEGMGFNHLGVIHQGLGENEQALAYFEQTLPVMRETGDRWGESAALSNLGVVSHRLGDFSGAKAYYEGALAICQEIGEWGGEVSNLSNLGWLAYNLGDLVTAETNQLRVLQMARERSPEVESLAWLRLGRVWTDQERLEEARDAFRRALALRRDLGRVNLALEPMAGLARVELALGELEEAREQVEDTLAALELPFSNLLDNADDPYWVYLSCVLVLHADGDPASEIWSGHTILQKQPPKSQKDGRQLRKTCLGTGSEVEGEEKEKKGATKPPSFFSTNVFLRAAPNQLCLKNRSWGLADGDAALLQAGRDAVRGREAAAVARINRRHIGAVHTGSAKGAHAHIKLGVGREIGGLDGHVVIPNNCGDIEGGDDTRLRRLGCRRGGAASSGDAQRLASINCPGRLDVVSRSDFAPGYTPLLSDAGQGVTRFDRVIGLAGGSQPGRLEGR